MKAVPCEEAQDDERSAEGFEHAGYSHQRGQFRFLATEPSEPAEELLVSVQRERKSHDNPEQ